MPTRVLRPAILFLAAAVAAAGCTRPEIEQGNYLTRGQVTKVSEGMERAAVRRTLGEPLIQDPFHPDRWDYVYTRISKEGEKTRRRLTLFFDDGGQVDRIVRGGAPYPEAYSPEAS
jgi:outer membrane protein assembly factor BamE